MTRLKYFLSNQFQKLDGTIKRFYLPLGLIIVLFFVTSSMTVWTFNEIIIKVLSKLIYTLAFGIFTCILAEILYEKYFRSKVNKPIFDVIPLIISAVPYIFLYLYENNIFVILALSGIVISEIIFILYFSKTDSVSETFSYFFKNLVFSFFACTIIFAGVAICILAFTSLIYNFKDSYKAYLVLSEFVGIVLFETMLLSIIPKSKQKITIPRVFKIIISKIMLPVYILLLSILYVYLGKILFTWTFPSGKVNWFVSFSSLLLVFFSFSLCQYKNENKAINWFLKFGGLAILPTIAMQFVAIYIRVSSYGLTIPRYTSIVLNIFAVVFVIMFLLWREKSLKHSLTVLAGFILLITITPLNIIDIPMREQSYRLKTLLLNNNMLSNNSIIPNKNLALKEKSKIIESYRYIKSSFGTANYKPNFLNEDLIKKSEKEIFGFEKTYEYSDNFNHSNIYFDYNYNHIDVGNYSKLYNISGNNLSTENNNITINYNNKNQIIEGFYNYLKDLYSRYKELGENRVTNEKIEYEFGNNKLVLSNVRLYQDENEAFKVDFYNGGYLLEK